METNVLFKKFEIVGTTKDEAINNVKEMNLLVDATQSYKKWAADKAVNDADLKEWMKDYLRKKKYNKAGIGAYIVLQSHIVDSRERPYQVEKMKYEARTHSPEKYYVLRDATNHEIARVKTSKEAEAKAKEFVSDFKEDVTINYEWVAKEKNSLYAVVKYTPSKGSRPCKLLCFGYIAAE